MKRMHIHAGVERLDQAITFYSALFGEEPNKTRPDYARWMLDDPRINFAVSTRGKSAGVDHLGIQVDDAGELGDLRARLKAADLSTFDEGETVCCYARSEKTWVEDPAGIAWEAYNTMDDVQFFGSDDIASESACCAPEGEPVAQDRPANQASGCCG